MQGHPLSCKKSQVIPYWTHFIACQLLFFVLHVYNFWLTTGCLCRTQNQPCRNQKKYIVCLLLINQWKAVLLKINVFYSLELILKDHDRGISEVGYTTTQQFIFPHNKIETTSIWNLMALLASFYKMIKVVVNSTPPQKNHILSKNTQILVPIFKVPKSLF